MIWKSVQQIMLAQVLKNEKQAEETLKAVKNAGFDAIELNGFMLRPSGMLVRMLTRMAGMPTGNCGNYGWKALVESSGLRVTAIHEDLGTIEREMENVLKEALDFGTDKIVVTGMYRFDYTDEVQLLKLAERLNAAGEKLKKNGVTLLYHNHNTEFRRLPDGRVVYDVLMENTDPELLAAEFDSYWAADIGANALGYMQKLGKRLKLYHVNDRGVRPGKTPITPILKSDAVELGLGAMDLPNMLDIAMRSPVDSVVLECHKNWIGGSPLRSLEISGQYLKEHLS